LRFLIDQQLPPALADWLRSDGVDAAHVRDLGLKTAPDRQIWSAASEGGAVVVTKDQDFVKLLMASEKARLIWIRVGNCPTHVLLARFSSQWPRIQGRLRLGDRMVEVR
jgi:predicted nuclease of predicted toxin-antitoxin system